METHSQMAFMDVGTMANLNRETTANEHIVAVDGQEHSPEEYESNHMSGRRNVRQGQYIQYQQQIGPQMKWISGNGESSQTQQNHCTCQEPGKPCNHCFDQAVRILSKTSALNYS